MYEDRLSQALERNGRHETGFAWLYVNVDNFKLINDTRGHAAGDLLLRALSARLRECVRSTGTVVSIGGDEFAGIVDGLVSAADAEPLVRKIVDEMRQPFEVEANPLSW